MKKIEQEQKRLAGHCWPLLFLFLLPVVANAVALSGIFNTDPTLQCSWLDTDPRGGWIGGPMGWLDPSVAYISQPIGHLVVSDWLHGIVPWWNPYSGIGMPLAAEMQSMAFFLPFVLLLHWNCGWLLLRVLLQICSGLSAYALFVELNLRREAALLGSALYGLSPLFFLTPNAPIDTLPFLPLLLLGIEYSAKATQQGRTLGWSLVTIAVTYSILGGFPEMAYLHGLLAAMWSLWRITTLRLGDWPRFAAKLGLAVLLALCICAPLLTAFLEYLPMSYLGIHDGAVLSHVLLPSVLTPLQIFPLLYGPLGSTPPLSLLGNFGGGWVRMPGWVGLPILTLAVAALWRCARLSRLRYVLMFWVVLWEARYLGFAPAMWLINHIPMLPVTDTPRYSGPMLDFSVFCLAAFGFDDLLKYGAMSRPRLAGVVSTILLVSIAAIVPISRYLFSWWEQVPSDMVIACTAGVMIVLILILLCRELRHPRHPYALLLLLLAGPLLMFVYPQFAGFRGGRIDLAPVRFLQANAGIARMISLGPLDLNFPVRYGIASINYDALPAPAAFADYIASNLFAGTDFNIYSGNAAGEQSFVLQHLPEYEALGVRYIVAMGADAMATTPFPLEDLTDRGLAFALFPGAPDLTGSLALDLAATSIKSASLIVGTYEGISRGPLTLTLCAAGHCQAATADLGNARDDLPLNFELPSPLDIPQGATLSFRISHPSGSQVAIWLAPAPNGADLPHFAFDGVDGASDNALILNDLTLAFRDRTVSIYRLAHTAPYASASGDCKLDIISRQIMHSLCSSQGNLIRRELYFPGWSARVNGARTQISQAGVFQRIQLPSGDAQITFTYTPPHSRLAYLIALTGCAIWGLFYTASAWSRCRALWIR